MTYDRSVIQSHTAFNPQDFPEVCEELSSIKETMLQEPVYFNVEILISFLKDHSLRTDWIEANPSFAKLITSGGLKISLLEGLFASGKKGSNFLTTLEDH